MKQYLTKRNTIIAVVVLVVGLGIWRGFFAGSGESQYDTVTVSKRDLTQEVSVTGKVQAAQTVDLAFERTGRVVATPVSVSQQVKAGQLLVQLDAAALGADLLRAQATVESARASLTQYEAALASQQAKLDELKKGTRTEEIAVAQVAVSNAERALTDARQNFTNVESKAAADAQSGYDAALTAAGKAVTVARGALLTLTDIQTSHFNTSDQQSTQLASAKGTAVAALLGGINAGYWNRQAVSQANGGAAAAVAAAQSASSKTTASVKAVLVSVAQSLNAVKLALDAVPQTTDLSATELANLSAEKASLSPEIISVGDKVQDLDVQVAINNNAISTAQASVNDAMNALSAAQSQLALKQAGATAEQIAAQVAQVAQAQANVSSQLAAIKQAQASLTNTQALLGQAALRAPFDGIVTKQSAKVGEIISPGTAVVSLISQAGFEVEANVPEVDVAKLSVGDSGRVTLDAYGDDVVFTMKITEIDPAETIVDGVSTYKTTLQFDQADERIKSGMTANVDIATESRTNVLAVPQRAVIVRGSEKIVRVVRGSGEAEEITEVKVQTGLRDSQGNIEITEGLAEGDRVAISSPNE